MRDPKLRPTRGPTRGPTGTERVGATAGYTRYPGPLRTHGAVQLRLLYYPLLGYSYSFGYSYSVGYYCTA